MQELSTPASRWVFRSEPIRLYLKYRNAVVRCSSTFEVSRRDISIVAEKSDVKSTSLPSTCQRQKLTCARRVAIGIPDQAAVRPWLLIVRHHPPPMAVGGNYNGMWRRTLALRSASIARAKSPRLRAS